MAKEVDAYTTSGIECFELNQKAALAWLAHEWGLLDEGARLLGKHADLLKGAIKYEENELFVDMLSYWSESRQKQDYPLLSKLARAVFSIQNSGVAVERCV